MSYSYENLAVDKSKANYTQKCFYIINLIKMKSPKKWEELRPKFEGLKAEGSWDFYQELIYIYQGLSSHSSPAASKKVVKKAAPAKKAAPKKAAPKKKAPAKKAAKKPAKKAAKKKASKKPTKKK